MKIGLVCPYNIAKGGGVQEIVRAEHAELTRMGHDAYVITPQPREENGTYRARKTIFVGNSTDFNSPLHTTVQVSAGVHEAIDRVFSEHRFDVLHFHEPWVPMLSMQLLTRSNSVNVATFHAKLPETFVSRTVARVVTPYTKSVLKYIHELTAVSEAAADYLGRLTDRPVRIIPNGIDLHTYKPPRAHKDGAKAKTIFYIGRLEQRKGVRYLLHAFALLHQERPEVTLVIASDGPDRRKLEQLAADLGVADNVEFRGYISDKDKVRYLKSADLFCSPALYGESFGIVLLEAMASGLVTVAGDNPGYASVMKGLGAISLINPRHTEEFARRLDLLLYENDLRKLWRDWAKAEVLQYGYPQVVAQYEEVFKQAFKQHGRAA
jgi:phosphatidylinositol alpha-mannosyltransferase